MVDPAPQTTTSRTAPWIISEGRLARFDFSGLGIDPPPATARLYRLSALGRYLIQPEPVVLSKRLIGCELIFQGGRKWSNRARAAQNPIRLISDFATPQIRLRDDALENHLASLQHRLSAYDSLIARLDGLDADRLADITGICEDPGGNPSPLRIEGTVAEKLAYIRDNLLTAVPVRLAGAHVSQGLFELGGFDFSQFNPSQSFRLVRFSHDGQPKGCVLRADHTVDFWLPDTGWVHYLQLFEHSIRTHPQMADAMTRFMDGTAVALRIMVNLALSIDYSRAPLPAIYQEVCRETSVPAAAGGLLKRRLSQDQVAVSMNYLPPDRFGAEALRTQIAILQDVRAIEALKTDLPTVYSAIAKQAVVAEGGAYYLLDAIGGAGHGV